MKRIFCSVFFTAFYAAIGAIFWQSGSYILQIVWYGNNLYTRKLTTSFEERLGGEKLMIAGQSPYTF